jgi:hypothetical protein
MFGAKGLSSPSLLNSFASSKDPTWSVAIHTTFLESASSITQKTFVYPKTLSYCNHTEDGAERVIIIRGEIS